MRRRTFLALAGTGLAAGTAGCFGIGGDGDTQTDAAETETETNPDTTPSARTTDAGESTTTTPTAPTTMNGETTVTTTGQPTTLTGTTDGGGGSGGNGVSGQVTGVPDGLEVTKQWFYRKQFSTGVRGILKNVSGSPFEYVEIRATFSDAEGTRLDTSLVHTTMLAAGEEWAFEVLYQGSQDPSQIAQYTLVVDTSPF